MSKLLIEKTGKTPALHYESEGNAFLLRGICIPEDPRPFFERLISQVQDKAKASNADQTFRFRLDYFNTLSAKYLYDFLKKITTPGLQVIWEYEAEDEDMLEAGQEFAVMLEADIVFL